MKTKTLPKADGWLFKRRGAIVLAVCLFLFGSLPAALAYRQCQFNNLTKSGYLGKDVYDPIPAKRGSFVDRNGIEIAGCAVRFEIFANPRRMANIGIDIGKAAEELMNVLGIEQARIERELRKNTSRVVLCKSSSPEQRDILKDLKSKNATKFLLEEVGVERFYERIYPKRGLPGNILGWVRREGSSLMGVEGLEYKLGYLLKGQNGLRMGIRGLNGLPLATGYRIVEEAVAGNDILLTIDRDVQVIAYENISHWVQLTGALRGAVVIVKSGSGDILAIAQYPGIELTNFQGCIDNAELLNDFACRSLYEPGSVGKAFIAANGIDAGAIGPETSFFVNYPPVIIDGYPVGEYTPIWDKSGRHSLREILVRSSNLGMYKVGLLLRKDGLVVDALYRFGFADQPDLYLGGMPRAMIPDRGESLCDIETANISFGQGYAVTPVQVALAFNVFASNGVYHSGRLVHGVKDGVNGKIRLMEWQTSRQAISTEACREMVVILHEVTTDGTGRRAVPDGYLVAGKSGTGQVPSPSGGYYDDYHIVSFAGFGPLPDPRYTVLVVIERPRGGTKYDAGGKAAAPCFKDVFTALMDLDKRRANGEDDLPAVQPVWQEIN